MYPALCCKIDTIWGCHAFDEIWTSWLTDIQFEKARKVNIKLPLNRVEAILSLRCPWEAFIPTVSLRKCCWYLIFLQLQCKTCVRTVLFPQVFRYAPSKCHWLLVILCLSCVPLTWKSQQLSGSEMALLLLPPTSHWLYYWTQCLLTTITLSIPAEWATCMDTANRKKQLISLCKVSHWMFAYCRVNLNKHYISELNGQFLWYIMTHMSYCKYKYNGSLSWVNSVQVFNDRNHSTSWRHESWIFYLFDGYNKDGDHS